MMSQSPGRYEFSNQGSLAQNNVLRETINAIPKRGLPKPLTPDDWAQVHGMMDRVAKGDQQEYRVVLRKKFTAQLAASYATPSLQTYALILFEDVYDSGLKNDAMVRFAQQKYQPTSYRERALLLLAAADNLNSSGLYDLQTAKEIETLLYRFALNDIDHAAGLIQAGIDIPPDKQELQQLQEITPNWQQEYLMQYGENISQK
jgi:hypothetical protein